MAGESGPAAVSLRIASWNVNSVRLRLANLARLIEAFEPDVICLQETKVPDEAFPLRPLERQGYRHVLLNGMKGYNGVALLARVPFEPLPAEAWGGRRDCRHAAARLAGGIELHNVYVPAGGDVPDPKRNDKFRHKLRFLDQMTAWFAKRRSSENLVLCGDFNVAPLDSDVWSHRQLLDVVSHTPIEVRRIERLQATVSWVDAVRRFVPPAEKLFTWWSYRARDWSASDRGRRLDHLWVTPALARRLESARVLREARGWEAPSDHAPVVVEIG